MFCAQFFPYPFVSILTDVNYEVVDMHHLIIIWQSINTHKTVQIYNSDANMKNGPNPLHLPPSSLSLEPPPPPPWEVPATNHILVCFATVIITCASYAFHPPFPFRNIPSKCYHNRINGIWGRTKQTFILYRLIKEDFYRSKIPLEYRVLFIPAFPLREPG